MKLHRKNLNMETEVLLNELFKIQKRLDSLEEENKKLKALLEKHINFIDDTYQNLKNPIEGVRKIFGR